MYKNNCYLFRRTIPIGFTDEKTFKNWIIVLYSINRNLIIASKVINLQINLTQVRREKEEWERQQALRQELEEERKRNEERRRYRNSYITHVHVHVRLCSLNDLDLDFQILIAIYKLVGNRKMDQRIASYTIYKLLGKL